MVIGVAKGDDYAPISIEILRRAYHQLAIKFEIKKLPAKRLFIEANKGRVDADLHRIKGIDLVYRNLIRVPVMINHGDALVFSKKHSFQVTDWKSLSSYRIGTIKGFQFSEQGTAAIDSVIQADNFEQLISMLELDRIDVAIGLGLFQYTHQQRLKMSEVKALTPALDKVEVYHYLHKKHADLVSPLTQVLEQMKQSGELEKIRTQKFIEHGSSN